MMVIARSQDDLLTLTSFYGIVSLFDFLFNRFLYSNPVFMLYRSFHGPFLDVSPFLVCFTVYFDILANI